MDKLKLSAVPDDKPVKLRSSSLPPVHRDLAAYAEVLGRESGHAIERDAGAQGRVCGCTGGRH